MFNSLSELKEYIKTIDIEEINLELNFDEYLAELETWSWGENYEQLTISPFSSETTLKTGESVDPLLAQKQFFIMREKAKTESFWLRLTTYQNDAVAVNLFKNLHFIFPRMCEEITNEVYKKLGVKFDSDKVGLLKSNSNIAVHQDQPARVGGINIFLKNAEAANFCCFKTYESSTKYKTINTITKKSYLVNTNSWHSVEKFGAGDRYAFSISIQ